MQNNNGMSGNNYNHNDPSGQPWSNRDFTPMMPGINNINNDSGFGRPRYVPPQRRGHGLDDPIRPESSMSNASFITSNPHMDGGVSLSGFMGNGSGRGGAYGMNPQMNPQMGGGGYGGYAGPGQGMPGGMGMGGNGGFGPPGGMGSANFGGGYGGPANYSFNQQAPPVNMYPSLDMSNNGMRPVARPSAGPGGFVAPVPSNTSSNSAHDSVGGASKAFNLASMIRSGAADAGDDYEALVPGSGPSQGFGRKTHRASLSTAVTQHRPTRSTADALMQPANPVNALTANREGNTKGNAAAYLAVEVTGPPDWFAKLQMGFKPDMQTFFEVMPVIEPCRYAVASTAGVVRVNNIPYNTPRSEITAFVGRNAQIVSQPEGSPYHAVHIIMERHTGKTMDAFIEFSRASEATWVCNQFQKRIVQGRAPRVGDRQVEVVLSSQEELMSELFPRTKNVRWEGATPRVLDNQAMYYPGVEAAGFTGFLQNEEIVMVVKHAETPHRSPFAQRCVVRVYESHISTLHKYPWFAHECVKMPERRLLFDATLAIMRSLIAFLRRTGTEQVDNSKPTGATLQELAVAALTCPGFSESQKATLVMCMQQGGYGGMTTSRGMNIKFGGNFPIANFWPFKVLARDPKASDEMVNYFVSLINEATTGGSDTMSLADQHAARASGGNADGPFGDITFDYGSATTMAEVGKIELRTIESLLGRVLPRSRANTNSSNHS